VISPEQTRDAHQNEKAERDTGAALQLPLVGRVHLGLTSDNSN